jgi:hypothetical protein
MKPYRIESVVHVKESVIAFFAKSRVQKPKTIHQRSIFKAYNYFK